VLWVTAIKKKKKYINKPVACPELQDKNKDNVICDSYLDKPTDSCNPFPKFGEAYDHVTFPLHITHEIPIFLSYTHSPVTLLLPLKHSGTRYSPLHCHPHLPSPPLSNSHFAVILLSIIIHPFTSDPPSPLRNWTLLWHFPLLSYTHLPMSCYGLLIQTRYSPHQHWSPSLAARSWKEGHSQYTAQLHCNSTREVNCFWGGV